MKKRIRIGRETIFLLVGGVLCITLLASGLSLFFGGSLAQAQKTQSASRSQVGGEDETGPYDVATGWPQPLGHPGWTWGSQGGVFAETPNRIYIANRGELPIPEKAPEGYTGGYGAFGQPATSGKPRMENCILVVDGNGKLLEDWTQWDHLFEGGRGPHHVKISPYDPEKHVWVVDDMVQQVFEFTHDGKQLVMTLGERLVKGEDDKHFGRPTDIAWLPDGTFFISDGYINTRVVKFDKNGKYLMTWGTKGKGPGQFDLPHSIDIDAQRRVYVADRSNSRIQIFDENGKYLSEWDNIRQPYHIMITADQHLWVADGVTNKFLKYDLNGKRLYSWGTYGSFPGAFWGVHQFSIDPAGNLYAAETFGGRTQKFTPKPGADPATLIGQPVKITQISSR
ncbi:MAG TPA: peptidyl-alpha-hydroxyglycine alpha-amidating lyase family protein [Rugosimonospora sp.]|nr:peptidyl-alpha-hydroxyglycine alpha-amidating lyase family protein [Rugosimonospora sp.]